MSKINEVAAAISMFRNLLALYTLFAMNKHSAMN